LTVSAKIRSTFWQSRSQKRLAIAQADLHFSWGYELEKKYAFEEAIAHYTTAFEIDKQYRRDRAVIDINNIGPSCSVPVSSRRPSIATSSRWSSGAM
jgi:hypothetical protein